MNAYTWLRPLPGAIGALGWRYDGPGGYEMTVHACGLNTTEQTTLIAFTHTVTTCLWMSTPTCRSRREVDLGCRLSETVRVW